MYKNLLQGLTKTKFINFRTGSPDKLFVDQRPLKKPSANEVLLKIKATGINPAQVLQRMGKYPVNPKIEQEHYLGLEAVGEVFDNEGNKIYDGMALLSGGGYGQYTVVSKDHVMRKPEKLEFSQAAAITEAWLTAYQILKLGKIRADCSVAINGATGSVGSAAIQICSLLKAHPYVIVTSPEQIPDCQKLGAKGGVSYKEQAWAQKLKKQNGDKGFDILLDSVCASQFKDNLEILGEDSVWMLYGFQSGSKLENVNIAPILSKRISLVGTTLKARSSEFKKNLIKGFSEEVLPHFDSGQLQLKIDSVLRMDWGKNDPKPFIEAHQKMQDKKHKGKIVIQYQGEY